MHDKVTLMMAMIRDPNAIVPKWKTVVLKRDVKRAEQGTFVLSLVQYHLANTPARTISPYAVTKFMAQ